MIRKSFLIAGTPVRNNPGQSAAKVEIPQAKFRSARQGSSTIPEGSTPIGGNGN